MPSPDGISRYDPTRSAVPEGFDVTVLCVCCTHTSEAITRDGLWAKCKRCDEDCTNVGCRELAPGRRGIYGRFTRRLWPRLFR